MSEQEFIQQLEKMRETFDKYTQTIEKQNEKLRESLKERDEKIDKMEKQIESLTEANKKAIEHHFTKSIDNERKEISKWYTTDHTWGVSTGDAPMWTQNSNNSGGFVSFSPDHSKFLNELSTLSGQNINVQMS